MIVYQLVNTINFKSYIGKHNGISIWTRWDKRLTGGNPHFAAAVKKYGWNAFERQIRNVCSTVEEMNNYEKLWIVALRTYDPKYGYNMRMGGEGGGIPTGETRKKISDSHKAKLPFSEERIKRIKLIGEVASVAMKENWQDEEYRKSRLEAYERFRKSLEYEEIKATATKKGLETRLIKYGPSRRRPKYSKEFIDKIIELRQQGKTQDEIASIVGNGMDQSSISLILKKNGYTGRIKKEPKPKKPKVNKSALMQAKWTDLEYRKMQTDSHANYKQTEEHKKNSGEGVRKSWIVRHLRQPNGMPEAQRKKISDSVKKTINAKTKTINAKTNEK